MDERYVEALNSMSLEEFGSYLESCSSENSGERSVTGQGLRLYEDLNFKTKLTIYALAIIACPRTTDDARAWATEKLHGLM